MPFFPLDKWFVRTAVVPNPRGRELDAVDRALDAYHHFPSIDSARKLYQTMQVWTRSVGADWRNHDRNRNFAISKLYDELDELLSRGKPIDELDFWRLERRRVVNVMFESARLELKGDYCRPYEAPPSAELARVSPAAKEVAEGANLVRVVVEQIIRTQVDASVGADVLQYLKTSGLHANWIANAGTALLPFKSVISNGARLQNLIRTASEIYTQQQQDPNQAGLDLRVPHTAAQSVVLILAHEKTRQFVHAPKGAVATAGRAVCQAFDASQSSPAITRAGTVFASLVQRLFYVGRDFTERRDTNHFLSSVDNIDATTFKRYPILGCYVLAHAETRSIVAFFQEYGRVEWMDGSDRKVRSVLRPLQAPAMKFIEESRFQIVKAGSPIINLGERPYVNGEWQEMSSEQYHQHFGGGVSTTHKTRIARRYPGDD